MAGKGRDVGVQRIVWWNWQLSATRALDEARGLGGDFDVRFREMQPRRAVVHYKSRGADVEDPTWFGNAWSRGERAEGVCHAEGCGDAVGKEELELGGFGRCGRGAVDEA